MVAAIVGSAWWLFADPTQPSLPPVPEVSATATDMLYATTFPDIDGREQSLSHWRRKTLVLNYWATWCKPCREEMPMLSKLHERYGARGVQFVGIAADEAGKVREFARLSPVSYPILIGGEGAIKLTRDFGNGPLAVPFTIVLDPEGNVRTAVLGRVDEKALAHLLDGLTQGK